MSARTKCAARIAAVLALLLPAAAGGAFAQNPAFLADVDDLPLAPGLVEDSGARVAFDKPGGRIVQALASGATTPEAVRAFYAETLPALGWRPGGAGSWIRDAETLRLAVEREGAAVVVRYAIAPLAP